MKIAHAISVLLHPLWVPTLGMATLLSIHPYYSLVFRDDFLIRFLIFIFTFSALLPALIVGWLFRIGKVSSIHLPLRSERIIPLLGGFISFSVAYLLMINAGIPPFVEKIMLSGILLIAACFIANHYIKISIHMAAWSALCGQIFLMGNFGLGMVFLPLIITVFLTGLAGSARLFLAAHRPIEILLGCILGLMASVLIIV